MESLSMCSFEIRSLVCHFDSTVSANISKRKCNSKPVPEIMDMVTKAFHHISRSLQTQTRTLFSLVQHNFFPRHSNPLFV